MSPLRIGVVGIGVIGRCYLDAITADPALRLAAVCDSRAGALASAFGTASGMEDTVPRFAGHHTMLAEAGLDAVVVTVPNDAHHAVCRDVLAARVAVCVEKPLATTMADARDLERLARRADVPLFTAFHRRYNDNLGSMLSEIDGSRPVSVVVRYLERIEDHVGPDAWYLDPKRCGGGCVADNGPNAFDVVRRILGEVEVTSAVITRDAAGVDRRAVIGLRSPAGAVARVELDWSFPGEIKDVRVELADGTVLRADLLAGHPEFKSSLRHEYRGVVADFAEIVRTRRRDQTAGLAALALVEDCYRIEGTP